MTGTVSTPDVIAVAIRLHYDEAPLDDYDRALLVDLLIDALPDGHPDVELARSGVWSGTLAEWLEVGPGIVRRVPLVSVELTDRKPSYTWDSEEFREDLRGRYCWYLCEDDDPDYPLEPPDSYYLPAVWYPGPRERDWVAAGKTEELALADVSQRAIAWARRTEVTP